MPGIDDVNHALATARRLADAAGARRRHLAQRAQRILQEFHGVTA